MSQQIELSGSVMFAQNVVVREAATRFLDHPAKHPQEILPLPDWNSMVIVPGKMLDDSHGTHREVTIRASGAIEFGGEVNVHFNVTLQLLRPQGEKKWSLKNGTGTLSEPRGQYSWRSNDCPNGGGASVWVPIK